MHEKLQIGKVAHFRILSANNHQKLAELKKNVESLKLSRIIKRSKVAFFCFLFGYYAFPNGFYVTV